MPLKVCGRSVCQYFSWWWSALYFSGVWRFWTKLTRTVWSPTPLATATWWAGWRTSVTVCARWPPTGTSPCRWSTPRWGEVRRSSVILCLRPGRPSGSLRLLCCLHHWGTVAHLEKGRRQTWLAPFNLIWFYSAITNFLLRLGTRRLTSTTRYSWRSGSSSSSAGSGWPRPSTIPSARTMRTLSWMNSSTGKFIGKFELKLVKSWNLSFWNDYIRCFPTELPSDISTWRWVWWTSTRWERGPTLMIWLFPCCRTPRS